MINIPRTALYCVSAVALTLAVSSTAFAQGMTSGAMSSDQTGGHGTRKVIAENEKLQVLDVVYRPGEGAAMASRLGMVIHFLTDATFERDFADGSKKTSHAKLGKQS